MPQCSFISNMHLHVAASVYYSRTRSTRAYKRYGPSNVFVQRYNTNNPVQNSRFGDLFAHVHVHVPSLVKKNHYSSLTFSLTPELNWCSSTKGNSTRNWESWEWILFLMVLAAYSCLLEATQHGTMLWASTCTISFTYTHVHMHTHTHTHTHYY